MKLPTRLLQTVALASCLGLSACATTGPVLDRFGATDTTGKGLALRFNTSATAALTAGSSHDARQLMLADGFALIYANCSDYFENAGVTQTWLITAKDAVGVLGTIGSGAVALTSGSDDAVAAIAFSSSAINSGIDLYTRNYLFGADNIDAVRSLTLRAIATHQATVLQTNPDTIGEITQSLLDDQNYCRPRKIAAMARDAIKAGQLEAWVSSGGETRISTQGDDVVRREVAKLLGLPGFLSNEQAGALWWLVKGSPSTTDLALIKAELSLVPTDVGPFDAAGAYKGNAWDLHDRVLTSLSLMSPGLQASFVEWIAKKKAAAAAPPPPGFTAPPPILVKPPPSFGSGRSSRVEVDVRGAGPQ